MCSIDTNCWEQPITDPSLPVLSPQGEHQQGSFLRHAGHQEEEDSQQEMRTVHSMTTAASLAESLCVCVCVLQGSLRSPLVLSGLQDKQQTQMGDRCFFFSTWRLSATQFLVYVKVFILPSTDFMEMREVFTKLVDKWTKRRGSRTAMRKPVTRLPSAGHTRRAITLLHVQWEDLKPEYPSS